LKFYIDDLSIQLDVLLFDVGQFFLEFFLLVMDLQIVVFEYVSLIVKFGFDFLLLQYFSS